MIEEAGELATETDGDAPRFPRTSTFLIRLIGPFLKYKPKKVAKYIHSGNKCDGRLQKS